MRCPHCQADLRIESYEGVEIETCDGCGGEWIDYDELRKIVRLREVKFTPEEQRAISAASSIAPDVLKTLDRDLPCPKCGGTTDALNYGGDTGIVVDRCTQCHGIWLDREELEKVQAVIEGWDDALPEDLRKYGPKLHDVAVQMDRADDVRVSRLPFVGRFINAAINGILDLTA